MPSAAGVVVQEPLGSGVRFRVYGIPAPKGSKTAKGRTKTGRVILVESCARVKPWIESIKWAAIEQKVQLVPGAVCVRTVFTLPKPVSAPKKRRTYPCRKPDVDKLLRCVFDALTEAGVIEDDGRVVCSYAWKTYPNEHPDALRTPGVLIEVTPL